jgi:hypothetical protein
VQIVGGIDWDVFSSRNQFGEGFDIAADAKGWSFSSNEHGAIVRIGGLFDGDIQIIDEFE